jgi:hypothetical protein
MLGGIAQAEVNDQLKDLDDSNPQQGQKWKSYSPNQFGSYTSNTPVYQVYGQDNNQRSKKNSGQTGNRGTSSSQKQFPLVSSLLSYNKNKNQSNKQKSPTKSSQNSSYRVSDYSEWSQPSKKHKNEPQTSSSNSNSHYVLRPVMRNKQAREENFHPKGKINRVRQPQLPTEMRPPPLNKQRTSTLIVKKVV